MTKPGGPARDPWCEHKNDQKGEHKSSHYDLLDCVILLQCI